MRLNELVSGWMTDRPVTITPDRPVAEALATMSRHGIRHLLVVDGERLLGVVSDRDIACAARLEQPVSAIMTADEIITADPLTTLAEAARTLVFAKVGALPVLDGGRLVGLVTTHDLLRAQAVAS